MANPSRIPEIPIDPYRPLREFVHAALEASSFAIVAARVFAVAFALVLFITTAGHAQPLPIPWFAACPPGYYSNGGFCIPSSRDTREAIVLLAGESCPPGWITGIGWCQRSGGWR